MSYSISQTSRPSFRDKVANQLVRMGKPIYTLMRIKRKPWDHTVESLSEFPDYSLGKELAIFLETNGFQLMPRAEFHDVYHVLFQYGTSMKEETALQFVVIGNGRYSLPNLVSSGVAIAFYPEHWSYYKASYLKGKRAKQFYQVNFQHELHQNAAFLRREFRLENSAD